MNAKREIIEQGIAWLEKLARKEMQSRRKFELVRKISVQKEKGEILNG